MISLVRLNLFVCVFVALIAILPHHLRAEIDPSAAEEDPQSSPLSKQLEILTDDQTADEESYAATEWQRLVKSMCLNLIATNDDWFAQTDSALRRKCVSFLLGDGSESSQASASASASSRYNNGGNRQRRFFQINVGKTNKLKGESDSKGFKYGRK